MAKPIAFLLQKSLIQAYVIKQKSYYSLFMNFQKNIETVEVSK